MFKTLFRFSFALLMVVLLAFGWFLGQYKIVRTDDGYHAIRNEKWGFQLQLLIPETGNSAIIGKTPTFLAN